MIHSSQTKPENEMTRTELTAKIATWTASYKKSKAGGKSTARAWQELGGWCQQLIKLDNPELSQQESFSKACEMRKELTKD
jgi:hypothetical protein